MIIHDESTKLKYAQTIAIVPIDNGVDGGMVFLHGVLIIRVWY